MGIIVKKAGWQTMVMDQGRKNTRHLGVPSSGVTDLFQYWWANGLVHHFDFKGAGPAVLEVGAGPVEFVFDQPHVFAMTGSAGEYYLDDQKIPSHTTLHAKSQQILRIEKIARNGTIYLAIGGKWRVSRVYESASADVLSPFSGSAGNRLKDQDRIIIDQVGQMELSTVKTPDYLKPAKSSGPQTIRITAGAELHQCDQIKHALDEESFGISRNSSRMGYRLTTNQEYNHTMTSMVSSIVLPGMIQWPSGGEPILLLPNCQTTGGYPRVAKIIDADLWKLAYLGPGDHLEFKWTTREEAIYLRKYKTQQFTRFWNKLFPENIKNHSLTY